MGYTSSGEESTATPAGTGSSTAVIVPPVSSANGVDDPCADNCNCTCGWRIFLFYTLVSIISILLVFEVAFVIWTQISNTNHVIMFPQDTTICYSGSTFDTSTLSVFMDKGPYALNQLTMYLYYNNGPELYPNFFTSNYNYTTSIAPSEGCWIEIFPLIKGSYINMSWNFTTPINFYVVRGDDYNSKYPLREPIYSISSVTKGSYTLNITFNDCVYMYVENEKFTNNAVGTVYYTLHRLQYNFTGANVTCDFDNDTNCFVKFDFSNRDYYVGISTNTTDNSAYFQIACSVTGSEHLTMGGLVAIGIGSLTVIVFILLLVIFLLIRIYCPAYRSSYSAIN